MLGHRVGGEPAPAGANRRLGLNNQQRLRRLAWRDRMEINEIQKLITETAKVSNTGLKLLDRVFIPWNAKRSADANAQNTVQTALAQRLSDLIEGDRLSLDAYDILATCGGKMSVVNLANIMSKALPMLDEDADPSLVSDDWIANWRDKARLISDEEMTPLWAQLLASEANSPTSKSRKAVNVLADLEPGDAKLFRALSDFRLSQMRTLPFTVQGAPPPTRSRFNTAPNPPILVVLEPQNELYSAKGVDYESLAHLESLGLVKIAPQGYRTGPGTIPLAHAKGFLILTAESPVPLGQAYLTTAGSQLTELCVPLETPDRFPEYLANFWRSQGIVVSEDLNDAITSTFEAYSQDPETGEWINQGTGEKHPANHFDGRQHQIQDRG